MCVRPDLAQRAFPEEIELCPERGVQGDRWAWRTWRYLPNGRPDPRVQVAIMEHRSLRFIQTLTGSSHHPGDTIIADLDVAMEQLPTGSRLRVGDADIEISDVENDGCARIAEHFGASVLRWMRAPENRAKRLRGLFARVVTSGRVRAGDTIAVIP